MENFRLAQLEKMIIHKVGNRLMEESVVLSDDLTDVTGHEHLPEILKSYFLAPFKEPVFYHFHHVSSLELNEIYTIASALFKSTKGFVKKSKDIANILYEYSNHPKIKGGELYIVYFDECQIHNETTDAIGRVLIRMGGSIIRFITRRRIRVIGLRFVGRCLRLEGCTSLREGCFARAACCRSLATTVRRMEGAVSRPSRTVIASRAHQRARAAKQSPCNKARNLLNSRIH
jgi:hypothetical protein